MRTFLLHSEVRCSLVHRPTLFCSNQTLKQRISKKPHFDHEHKNLSFALSFVNLFPAGSEASETRCQLVETEHVLKVGVFPKGHLLKSRTCNYSVTQSREA